MIDYPTLTARRARRTMTHSQRAATAALLLASLVSTVHAQSAAGANNNANANDDKTIDLPAFTIETTKDDSYVGKEALSTTRTGVELLDLPQSVKVINRGLIDDMNPTLVMDTLKYVGGGQAGNINFADDRFVMRGFNSPANIGDFVDGFRGTTDSNTDTAIIDRLEIIKGPSAIFVANGPVGGVVNKILKGPVSYDIATVKVEAGLYNGDRAEIDLGGPIDANKKVLYRMVLAGEYADGYYDHTYSHRFVFAPSIAYVFNDQSQITFKYNYLKYNFSSYNGLPWDEQTNSVIPIDPKSTISEDNPLNWRHDVVSRGILEYTNRFNDHIAMRLAAFDSYNDAPRVESVYGSDIPLTYVAGTKLSRSTTAQDAVHYRRQLQADFVGTFKTGPVNHRLLAGGEYSDSPDVVASFPGTSSSIDPFNLQFPGTVTVGNTPSSDIRTNNRQLKGFALETATFWNDRVDLSYGVSRIGAYTSSYNILTKVATPGLRLTQNLRQYGVVFKVRKDLSAFYGYNENFAPNFQNGQVLPSQLGKQKELGIKADMLDGRLTYNVSYFDISQVNVPVLSFPQTTPPTFILVPGETSRGYDGDLSFKVNSNIDVLATFADLNARARSQANSAAPVIVNPVNNVAEHTYGLWGRYKFTDGPAKGFSLAVGLNHLSPRAVTDYANARVYGYLNEFTLTNLIFGYQHGKFQYDLNIDNVFNIHYMAAVRNQSIIVPGEGLNAKFSVMYKF
jgi:iron complex outermembrane receptor protein